MEAVDQKEKVVDDPSGPDLKKSDTAQLSKDQAEGMDQLNPNNLTGNLKRKGTMVSTKSMGVGSGKVALDGSIMDESRED